MPKSSSATGTTVTASEYCGRFAPSPTGPLHTGSLLAALVSYLDARAVNGRWLVRIEDIDPPREQPGAADDILRTLESFGLTWDGEVLYQSSRHAVYADAAAALRTNGRAFYCLCARQTLRQSNLAAGRPPGYYPGICRERALGHGALRFRVDDESLVVDDRLQPSLTTNLANDCGDFVIWRRDELPAYQLAVVIDDEAQGVTDVVRGIDLYDSTPRQIVLQRALGLRTPRYAHMPVLVDTAGVKLSKQTGAARVGAERPAALLHRMLVSIGQDPPAALAAGAPRELLQWASAHWAPARLGGIRDLPAASVAAQQNPVRS